MATGAYVRIERDGKWQAVEIDRMTDVELDELANSQPDRGWAWAKALAKWVRDHIEEDVPWDGVGKCWVLENPVISSKIRAIRGRRDTSYRVARDKGDEYAQRAEDLDVLLDEVDRLTRERDMFEKRALQQIDECVKQYERAERLAVLMSEEE